MKWQVFVEIVLIGLFAVYGVILIREMPPSYAQALIDANSRLRFSDARGIDVNGERVDSGRLQWTGQMAAFLLRNESLADDLKFWEEVSTLLPTKSDVHLVGYCDGSACANAVRANMQAAPFPVIAFGEMVDAQAVLNADMHGSLILKNVDRSGEARNIRWRDRGNGPANIVESMLR